MLDLQIKEEPLELNVEVRDKVDASAVFVGFNQANNNDAGTSFKVKDEPMDMEEDPPAIEPIQVSAEGSLTIKTEARDFSVEENTMDSTKSKDPDDPDSMDDEDLEFEDDMNDSDFELDSDEVDESKATSPADSPDGSVDIDTPAIKIENNDPLGEDEDVEVEDDDLTGKDRPR